MKLRSHGRYPYSGIATRPPGAWPNGARLAVYVALNLEQYRVRRRAGGGARAAARPQPDVLNYSWRDYGNRVGAWRLLDLFDELGCPARRAGQQPRCTTTAPS